MRSQEELVALVRGLKGHLLSLSYHIFSSAFRFFLVCSRIAAFFLLCNIRYPLSLFMFICCVCVSLSFASFIVCILRTVFISRIVQQPIPNLMRRSISSLSIYTSDYHSTILIISCPSSTVLLLSCPLNLQIDSIMQSTSQSQQCQTLENARSINCIVPRS